MDVFIGHLAKCMNSTEFRFDLINKYPVVQLENVRLKEPTAKYAPTLLLLNKVKDEHDVMQYKYFEGYNYMYIPEWGYYFIDDVIYETDGLISFHCTRDILATGHDYIKTGSYYMNFCSSIDDKVNPQLGLIDDPRFGPDLFAYAKITNFVGYTFERGKKLLWTEDAIAASANEGTVAVTTIMKGAGAFTYFLDFGQYLTLVGKIAALGDPVETTGELAKRYLFGTDWRSCFLSAYLVPIKPDYVNDWLDQVGTQKFTVGAGVETDLLDGAQVYATKSPALWHARTVEYKIDFVDMLKNPMYKWLRGPKYTKVTFEYPGGSVDLSSEANIDRADIFIVETFNLVTGDYVIKFYAAEGTGHTEDNQANCLGAARVNMAVDLFAMMTHDDPLKGIEQTLHKTFSAVGTVAKAGLGLHMSAQMQSIAASEAVYGKGKPKATYEEMEALNARQKQIKQTSTAEALRLSSGISGTFSSVQSEPVGSNYNIGDGLTTFFRASEDLTWVRNQCRIIVSTTLPSCFFADYGVVNENTPKTDTLYYTFGQQFGYPMLKYIDFKDFKTDKELDFTYVQCTGANCGFSGFLYGREPQSVHFTLTRQELAELNNQLNSNGVKLDSLYDDSWGTDPI